MKYIDELTNTVIDVRRYKPLTLDQIEHGIGSYEGMHKEDHLGYTALCQLTDVIRHNRYMMMRLAQIASGDYKTCGLFAENVAKDALDYSSNKSEDK